MNKEIERAYSWRPCGRTSFEIVSPSGQTICWTCDRALAMLIAALLERHSNSNNEVGGDRE